MRVELRSKLIESALYDEDARRLLIFFTNGERREFEGVPQTVFEQLSSAKSPGQFYFDHIRHLYSSSISAGYDLRT